MIVRILDLATDFAEDKDVAASIREESLHPALADGKQVTVDFTGVALATQSFIHAMISDVLRKHGEDALQSILFKGCQPGVRGIIETVVQYSLETLNDDNGKKS
jgi:hypothetical protein